MKEVRLYFGVTVQEGAGGHGGFAGGLELVDNEGAGGAGEEELVIRCYERGTGGKIGGCGRGGSERAGR